MHTHTQSVLVSGAGGKCRPASSLIALPVMRDSGIDQDLPQEQHTHTEYCPLSRLWRDGAIFGTVSKTLHVDREQVIQVLKCFLHKHITDNRQLI